MKMKQFGESAVKAELQMTSMIDIVFLLLIFFVMTFKISVQEGDFAVRMPAPGQASGPPPDQTDIPLKLRLVADSNGMLADLVLNDNLSFGNDFRKLNAYVLNLVGSDTGPQAGEGPEVELDLDYNLKYEYVIEAISAVTGQRQGNDIVRLIDRIKFAPPRKG